MKTVAVAAAFVAAVAAYDASDLPECWVRRYGRGILDGNRTNTLRSLFALTSTISIRRAAYAQTTSAK